ncbi:MAG TPA: MFS transporter [Vicinamibacterales bacterium]|nr:MFS transporter [Vicinamibacterales bacterium]
MAGRGADRLGRRQLLIAGWLAAVPVPWMLMWASTWTCVLAVNGLLGISQGLTWSTTVIMKIDLVGPKQRGLAMGLNEFAGYVAVAAAAFATGWVAAEYGLRPAPFYLGVAFTIAGLSLSLPARHTSTHAALESAQTPQSAVSADDLFWRTTIGDRTLSFVCQAGLVNNLNDGMAWGLLPIVFAAAGLSLAQVGALAAVYPATWGLVQLATGALSNRIGPKG